MWSRKHLVPAVSVVLWLAAGAAVPPAMGATTAYVANAFDGTLSIVDVARGETRATVVVGCDPRDVAVHPDGTRVYVANTCFDDPDSLTDTVSVVAAARGAVVATVPVGTAPIALALDPRGTTLYVANSGLKTFADAPGPGSISVIDTARDRVAATVPLDFNPLDVAVSPDGRRLYVSGSGLQILDTATLGIVGAFPGVGRSLAVHPSGRRLYVVEEPANELVVFDTGSGEALARLPVGTAAQDIEIDAAGERVYVTSAGDSPNRAPDDVTVIDTRTNTVAATFDGGWAPVGVASVATTGQLLLTNFYAGSLLVLDARTGARLWSIAVGRGADAVAVGADWDGSRRPARRGLPPLATLKR